jgi:hypothetical protein|tara:strand:+ start:2738 stop:2887 length:150 start_codon:yes stop_codon:yes gene_type:complete
MNVVFIGIVIFAIVLTICLAIVEEKRKHYEKKELNKNLKRYDDDTNRFR